MKGRKMSDSNNDEIAAVEGSTLINHVTKHIGIKFCMSCKSINININKNYNLQCYQTIQAFDHARYTSYSKSYRALSL